LFFSLKESEPFSRNYSSPWPDSIRLYGPHSLEFNLVITTPLGGPGRPGGIGRRRGKTGEKEIEERTITFNMI